MVTDVGYNAKRFFLHHLKQYIENNVLKEYIQEMPNANKVYVNQIVASRDLYYSKKLHGDRMLRNIQPDTVAVKCRKYFVSTYNAIVKAEL